MRKVTETVGGRDFHFQIFPLVSHVTRIGGRLEQLAIR